VYLTIAPEKQLCLHGQGTSNCAAMMCGMAPLWMESLGTAPWQQRFYPLNSKTIALFDRQTQQLPAAFDLSQHPGGLAPSTRPAKSIWRGI